MRNSSLLLAASFAVGLTLGLLPSSANAAPRQATTRGPLLSACLERADTNVQMRACADAEYRRQDDRLNAEYRRAQARLTAPRFEVLRQEQRAWLRTRDAECRRSSGSNGPLAQTLCRAGVTERRADYLARYPAGGAGADNASITPWLGRWNGPEGLFLEVEPAGPRGQVRLTLRETLDGADRYSGRFTGSAIEFERRGRREIIRRGSGSQTGYSALRSRRDCLIVIANREGYCRPN